MTSVYEPPPWHYAPPLRPTSGIATASMICGILGVTLCPLVVPSLVAVFLGHAALTETRDGAKGGHGMAIAGLILGYLVLVPLVGFLIIALAEIATTGVLLT